MGINPKGNTAIVQKAQVESRVGPIIAHLKIVFGLVHNENHHRIFLRYTPKRAQAG